MALRGGGTAPQPVTRALTLISTLYFLPAGTELYNNHTSLTQSVIMLQTIMVGEHGGNYTNLHCPSQLPIRAAGSHSLTNL